LLDSYFRDRPEAKEFLVDRRNRDWLGPLKEALARQDGTAMMTVGAAHIGGEKGLLALLCGEGFDVERVADGGAAAAKVCGAGA
jgi:uncharacterized protein YbaP (TraB family)